MHGHAARFGYALSHQAQLLKCATRSDVELSAHKIDAGNFLGDGMFDLKAWIGLNEDELRLRAGVLFDEEFKCSETA